MSAIHDFRSIKRKLDRQEQKAEWLEKNPPAPDWYSVYSAAPWPNLGLVGNDGIADQRHAADLIRTSSALGKR